MALSFFFSLFVLASIFNLAEMVPSTSMDFKFCKSQLNFSKEQMEFCYQNTELVKVLIKGYKMGHELCQKAFNKGDTNIRWNCTNTESANKNNVFFDVAHPKGMIMFKK